MSVPDSSVSTGVGALAVWLEAGSPNDTTLAVRVEVGFGEACGKEFLVPLGTADEPTSYLLFVSMGLITGRWMFEARRAVPAPVPEALQNLRKLRLGVPYRGARTGLRPPSGAIVGMEHGLTTLEACQSQTGERVEVPPIASHETVHPLLRERHSSQRFLMDLLHWLHGMRSFDQACRAIGGCLPLSWLTLVQQKMKVLLSLFWHQSRGVSSENLSQSYDDGAGSEDCLKQHAVEIGRLQSLAIQHGLLVTRPAGAGLKIVGSDSSQLLLQRLFQRAQALPVADVVQSALGELGFSAFLTTECVHRIQSDVVLLLLGRVRSLSLPDVRTEVLESWLEEFGPDSSESSMSCCGDCMVEQDRPSRKSLAVLHWFKASFLQVTAHRKSSNDRKDVQNVGYFTQARGYFAQKFGRFVQSCASRCLHVW